MGLEGYFNLLNFNNLISPKIANHPALQKNLLTLKEDRPPEKDIDKVGGPKYKYKVFCLLD